MCWEIRRPNPESNLSMNGINANTKCIYECLHKVCSSYGTSITLMDLLWLDCTFNFIPWSWQEIYLNLQVNTQLFPTRDTWAQSLTQIRTEKQNLIDSVTILRAPFCMTFDARVLRLGFSKEGERGENWKKNGTSWEQRASKTLSS